MRGRTEIGFGCAAVPSRLHANYSGTRRFEQDADWQTMMGEAFIYRGRPTPIQSSGGCWLFPSANLLLSRLLIRISHDFTRRKLYSPLEKIWLYKDH